MSRTLIHPSKKIGPLFISTEFGDTKDPCVVFDGTRWHIFGSGGSIRNENWKILHAVADTVDGPWTEIEPIMLTGIGGPHVAAPGVVFDFEEKNFHMAIQEDFTSIGGSIHYLVSPNGTEFTHVGKILSPIPDSGEAGLYDPHFSVIGGKKYLVYAGMPAVIPHGRPFIPQPDIYLATTTTGSWAGPWERIGKILDHDDISWHHNRRDYDDYEWGIEGPQLVELPSGKVLLNATSFIEEGERGTRQRVFFAIADRPEGPYTSLGPVLSLRDQAWEAGENGHASAILSDDQVYLFYQARAKTSPIHAENNWKYGIAVFDSGMLAEALNREANS